MSKSLSKRSSKENIVQEIEEAKHQVEDAWQNVLSQRARVAKLHEEIALATNSFDLINDRYPSHRDTLLTVREYLEEISGDLEGERVELIELQKEFKFFQANLQSLKELAGDLEGAGLDRIITEVEPPESIEEAKNSPEVKPFSLPKKEKEEPLSVVAIPPKATANEKENSLKAIINELKEKVKHLEEDNESLRKRVEVAVAKYEEKEKELRQSRLQEQITDVEAINLHENPIAITKTLEEEYNQEVFDDNYDEEVAELIELMDQFQVEHPKVKS